MQLGCRPATFPDLLDHGTVRKQILADFEILQTFKLQNFKPLKLCPKRAQQAFQYFLEPQAASSQMAPNPSMAAIQALIGTLVVQARHLPRPGGPWHGHRHCAGGAGGRHPSAWAVGRDEDPLGRLGPDRQGQARLEHPGMSCLQLGSLNRSSLWPGEACGRCASQMGAGCWRV